MGHDHPNGRNGHHERQPWAPNLFAQARRPVQSRHSNDVHLLVRGSTTRTLRTPFESEQERKRLLKSAVPKLRCMATKPNGERCSRTARPDYFGQMCSSHAPHIEDSPSLEEVRQQWPMHEYNREAGED